MDENEGAGYPRGKELDSLSEQIAQVLDGLGKANHGIEGAKKGLSGIWGLVITGVIAVWFVAQFVASYQQSLIVGSPALIKAVGDIRTEIAGVKKTDDDRYDKLSDILRSQVNTNGLIQQQLSQVDRRLTRLEDRK